MQTNPCYGDHTIPVYEDVQYEDVQYEEVQMQDKASDVIVKQNERISSSNVNKTNTNLRVVVVVVLANAMLAAITLSAYALVSSNQGMDSMMKEIQELKMQLNETKEASETELENLKRYLTRIETAGLMLQNSVDTAKTTTMTQLNSLQFSVNNIQSSVSSLNTANAATTTQLNSLQFSVNNIQSSVSSLNTANEATTTQLNSLQSSVNNIQSLVSSLNTANGATMTQLNSLQSSVSSLTSRVNSPVNLYQNCIEETTNCTIGPRTTDTYWAQCFTNHEPISKAGYYTTDIRCEYEAPDTGNVQETHILRKNGTEIQCQCHLSVLVGSQHAVIQSFVSTCSLVITRCPS